MVAKYNGKGPDKKSGGSKPSGKPALQKGTKIVTPASRAKAAGGRAAINGND